MKNRKLALTSLGAGTILFALAPPILKLLTSMGGRLGLTMPGSISFCNVLFVGNFCAGLVTLAYHGPRRTWREIKGLSSRTMGYLLLGAALSATYPALLFTGLERTSVINVVLLSRFNGIVFVVLAYLFLNAMIRRSEAFGYAVMGLGVAGLVIMTNHGLHISSGELFILASTVFFALTEVVSRKVLRECPIHAYVFFRNIVSALFFFATAIYLFGPEHFSEAFGGELWILMIAYAGLAVVAAQVLWLKGTSLLPAQSVANFQLVNPVFSILFAFLILSEVPSRTEWIAMAVILLGILIPRLAGQRRPHRDTSRLSMSPEMGLAGR